MGKEILTFRDIEIDNTKFYHNKDPISLKDEDIEKVLVYNKLVLVKKAISNLLVTCIMTTMLSHYT